MKVLPLAARIAALIVGLIAFAALAIRFAVSLEQAGSAQAAAWTMLRFFTIIGNLLTCIILFGVALGVKAAGHPRRLAGIMLLMGLIGVVYAVLLRSTENLSGPAETSKLLLHYIAPPAVALYWGGWLMATRCAGRCCRWPISLMQSSVRSSTGAILILSLMSRDMAGCRLG